MKNKDSELFKVLFPFKMSSGSVKKLPFNRACQLFVKMLELDYINKNTGKVDINARISRIFQKYPVDRSILCSFKRFMIPWFIGIQYYTGDDRELRDIINLLPLTKKERRKYNAELR